MAEALRDMLLDYRQRTKSIGVGAALVPAQGDPQVAVVGTIARGHDTAVHIDDAWHIGSCTKALTALHVGQLVEQGKASWDTAIADLYPDVSGTAASWKQSTIEDLLLCRAGVTPNPPIREMLKLHRDPKPEVEQRTEWVGRILAQPPSGNPGAFVYSNLGYVLVGAAIDRLAGVPYEEALTTNVLDPLGVTSAGFGPPGRVRGHGGRVRLGPLALGVGRPNGSGKIPADNPPLFTPAGRLHLNLTDWARVQQVFLGDGHPLISNATLERLFHMPDSNPGKPNMSMGWAPADALGGFRAMQGSNTMWVATAVISKDRDRTALVVTNDGRTKSFRTTAQLAARLLERS